jgi:hypothetical protein
MHESDTYQAILEEGMLRAAHRNLLIVGEELLGPLDEFAKAELNSITDLNRLSRMLRRAVTASQWREILDTP